MGGGGRGHQQGQDEDVADDLHRDDDGHRHQHVEQQVEGEDRKVGGSRSLAVQADGHQLLVDGAFQEQHDNPGHAHDDDVVVSDTRNGSEEELLQGTRVPRSSGDDDDSQREGSRKEDSDDGVLLEASVLGDDGHQDGSDETGHSTTDEQRPLE